MILRQSPLLVYLYNVYTYTFNSGIMHSFMGLRFGTAEDGL